MHNKNETNGAETNRAECKGDDKIETEIKSTENKGMELWNSMGVYNMREKEVDTEI